MNETHVVLNLNGKITILIFKAPIKFNETQFTIIFLF